LVLGGCGFIGSHLVDDLLAAGHKVRVVDRAPEVFRAPVRGVDYRFGDLSDASFVAEALEGIGTVYHLISTTVPSTSNLNPIADVQGNLIGTLQLLNLMVQKKIPRIVYLSSGGTVYGIPQSTPIAETHPLQPICSYGVVKVAVENYLQMFHHLYGMEYVVLRVSNPFGERQGHYGVQGVVGTFIGKLIHGDPIEIWGDGEIVRDYVYVGDLARVCTIVGTSGTNVSGVFNVGSGIGTSVNDVVEILTRVTRKSIQPVYKEVRTYDVPYVVLNIEKICSRTAWRPETSLEAGIRKTWEWKRDAANV
jgi:UDP-glucose 4-epimerase